MIERAIMLIIHFRAERREEIPRNGQANSFRTDTRAASTVRKHRWDWELMNLRRFSASEIH